MMSKTFIRKYFSIANAYFKDLNTYVLPNTYPNNNKLFIKIQKSLEKVINIDTDKNLPNLHRWCNTASYRYKNSCDWEKKIDNANRDNCYTNI